MVKRTRNRPPDAFCTLSQRLLVQEILPETLTLDEAAVVLEAVAEHLESRATRVRQRDKSGRLLYIAHELRKRAQRLAMRAMMAKRTVK